MFIRGNSERDSGEEANSYSTDMSVPRKVGTPNDCAERDYVMPRWRANRIMVKCQWNQTISVLHFGSTCLASTVQYSFGFNYHQIATSFPTSWQRLRYWPQRPWELTPEWKHLPWRLERESSKNPMMILMMMYFYAGVVQDALSRTAMCWAMTSLSTGDLNSSRT